LGAALGAITQARIGPTPTLTAAALTSIAVALAALVVPALRTQVDTGASPTRPAARD
jgi:hypothetical protein